MTEVNRQTERAILNAMVNKTIDTDTMVNYALKRLAQIDKRNEAARKRAAKKCNIADPLMEAVISELQDYPLSREDITYNIIDSKKFPEGTITVGKVAYRLNYLVKNEPELICRQEAYADDGQGHMRKLIVYSRKKGDALPA